MTSLDDGKSVEKLYNILNAECKRVKPSIPNGFGVCWLGELVTDLGEDWEKVRCRGEWESMELLNGVLSIEIESAWAPPYEVFSLIKCHFPEIDIRYLAIEEGCCVYETNDAEGKFFSERYCIDFNVDNFSDTMFFDTLEEVMRYTRKVSKRPIKTIDQANNWHFRNSENYININNICIVDDEF